MVTKDTKKEPHVSWWCQSASDSYRGGLGYPPAIHKSCLMKQTCACKCHAADRENVDA